MLHPSLRKLRDGTLVAPMRGKPPPCPEGYEVSGSSDYVFKLKRPECIHRYQKKVTTQCCVLCKTYCDYIGEKTTVTRLVCVECTKEKK